VPRNRTVRLAVLGSSVQRAAAAKSPSRARAALIRRAVAGVLVLLSLVMITLSFRSGDEGGRLDNLQGAAASVLRPFQIGIERVVRPFRDLYGYTSGLVDAKGEVDRLRAENRTLAQRLIQNELAAQENKTLRDLVHFHAPPALRDYDRVAAAVFSYPPSQFVQQLGISVGWADGVRVNDPVINGDGLVGKVTKVSGRTAQVTLLTDDQSAVSAVDLSTRAPGLVKRDRAGSNLLVLDLVKKSLRLRKGDEIVTAGSERGTRLESLYPRGIRIGKVAAVSQWDYDPFKRVQVEPYVNFDSVDAVFVLVPKGSER
jgi:rod shape-determining protein MreC